MPRSDVAFVFVGKDNEWGLVKSGRTGQYIPLHEMAGPGESSLDAAYRALNVEGGIEGEILNPDNPHISVNAEPRFHYYAARFVRSFIKGEKELRWFTEEQIKNYKANNIEDWVPGIMQEMKQKGLLQ